MRNGSAHAGECCKESTFFHNLWPASVRVRVLSATQSSAATFALSQHLHSPPAIAGGGPSVQLCFPSLPISPRVSCRHLWHASSVSLLSLSPTPSLIPLSLALTRSRSMCPCHVPWEAPRRELARPVSGQALPAVVPSSCPWTAEARPCASPPAFEADPRTCRGTLSSPFVRPAHMYKVRRGQRWAM